MLQQLKNHEVFFNLDKSIMLQIINLISSQIQAGVIWKELATSKGYENIQPCSCLSYLHDFHIGNCAAFSLLDDLCYHYHVHNIDE